MVAAAASSQSDSGSESDGGSEQSDGGDEDRVQSEVKHPQQKKEIASAVAWQVGVSRVGYALQVWFLSREHPYRAPCSLAIVIGCSTSVC